MSHRHRTQVSHITNSKSLTETSNKVFHQAQSIGLSPYKIHPHLTSLSGT
ncbi:MAG: hypothetical protein ACPGUY_07420 [Akkermansiaceae bacterium]